MRSRSERGSGLVVVVLVAAGAADDDLILLDRHLDGAVAGPVLGVDGVVLHGGVEPQAVALLAVVEGRLERARAALARAAAAPGAAARLGLLVLRVLVLRLGGRLGFGGLARGLLGGLGLRFGA